MNTGDTAFLLICTAMVLLMTPGLAFFYSGLVRADMAINTIKMSFIALGVIAVEWALVGYSFSFGPGNAFIGDLSFIGLTGVTGEPSADYATTVPHILFVAFQMMFAIITPALISGAVVGRMKFKAYVVFIIAWAALVYNPLAHWVWGGGFLADMGALDFAGGTVVHISAGVSAVVAALILGPRSGSAEEDQPHNVPFVVLGAALLWFGWFGFNAGSALAADGIAALALVTTMLSASSALVTWIALEWWLKGKPTAVGASIAAVVGLVTVTPAAGFITPASALAMGTIGALCSYFALATLSRTRLDDTLDVFACHGVGGIVGALLTGVFATTSVNPGGADGLLYGNAAQLWPQVASVLVTIVLAGAMTAGILVVLRAVIGLRADADEEGIDLTEHAEVAYTLLMPTETDERKPRKKSA